MEIVRKSRELEQGDLVYKKGDDTRIYMIIYDDNTDYCWCLLNIENAEITDAYESLEDMLRNYTLYAKSNKFKLIVED